MTIEARIPAATYRLQFNSRLTFEQAAGLYRDIFIGRRIRAERGEAGVELPLARVFAHLPLALLESVKE